MLKPVGIDVGYGYVKVFDGEDWISFPSVVGLAHETLGFAGLSNGARTRTMSITVDGQTYHVGELAMRQSAFAFRSLSQSRLEANEFKILFLTGLGLVTDRPAVSMHVVTGLPPGLLYQEKAVAQLLKGDHRVVLRLGKEIVERTLTVESLRILPQPMGTYLGEALDARGQVKDEGLVYSRTALVDIGHGTTDLAIAEGGEYVPHLSRTLPVGLATAQAEVSDRLRRELGIVREAYQLDDAMVTGKLKVAGQVRDISAIRDQTYKSLATKILTEVHSSWDVGAVDTILFTGGGSKALERFLLSQFPNARLVEPAQTANVRGYFTWAARATGNLPAGSSTTAASAQGIHAR
ncbi:MAG: hypothetical protein ACOY93_23095 [Bacillota bacterium]